MLIAVLVLAMVIAVDITYTARNSYKNHLAVKAKSEHFKSMYALKNRSDNF